MQALLATKQAEQVGLGNASSSADNEDFVTVSKGSGRTKRQYQKVDGSIYDHPEYYDWAFGYRNFESEVRVMPCLCVRLCDSQVMLCYSAGSAALLCN